MKHLCETAVILLGTLGWWGFVYPELCMTQESYEAVEEYEAEGGLAGEETICIRSRALEYVYVIKEKVSDEKDLNHDR